jgi:branched-chain amino acid transport system substrate-binding protein
MKRMLKLALSVATALLALSSWAPRAAHAETIRIGMPVPLTGFVAESARDMTDGFKLYLAQKSNKLGGFDVELKIEDTEANPQNALTKMRKLVENDKVHLVAGYLLAFEGLAVRDYAHTNKVPLILPIVAADDLTQRNRSPYIVRMTWTSSQPNHPFGQYAFNKLGYKRIATVAQDYAFGWENVGGFQTTFELAGGTIVDKIWVPLDAADYAAFVTKIPRDVDTVFSLLVGSHIQGFLKTYQDYGLKGKIPIIGGNILTDEDVLRSMQDEALGIITSHTYAASYDRPQNKAFVEAFRKAYSREPSYYAESMYTAAMWLDRALAKNGLPGDPLKFVDAIKAVDLTDAPRGPLKLDAYNNPIETVYIRNTVRKGSGLENQVIDKVENVSQFWTFNPEDYLKRPPYTRDFPPMKK